MRVGTHPYRCLEAATATLDWVRDRNLETLGVLSATARFAALPANGIMQVESAIIAAIKLRSNMPSNA